MKIRKATQEDIPVLLELLAQVAEVHHNIRPDIFKPGTTKYSVAELEQILSDEKTPVFVYTDAANAVQGYAFCVIKEHKNDALFEDGKTLYIDDLCVTAQSRGKHIGTALYAYVKEYAKKIGAGAITLNVWAGNRSAQAFYERLGMTVRSTTMEDKF